MQRAAVRDRPKNDGMTDRQTWDERAARLGCEPRSVLGRAVAPMLSPERRLDMVYAHAAGTSPPVSGVAMLSVEPVPANTETVDEPAKERAKVWSATLAESARRHGRCGSQGI